MNTVFSNCVPGFLVKDYEGKPFNILTEDNYEYLLGSYLRYAELTGVKARHVLPGTCRAFTPVSSAYLRYEPSRDS